MTYVPLVVLIDLDGTIIGDISPQVCEWELLQNLAPGKQKAFRDNLKTHLENGLVRPHFTTFLDFVKHHMPHTEFYVYTASDSKWAHVVIPCIEQLYGFQFNRPIFNRNHCIHINGEYRKSPEKLLPTIYSRMKQTYNMASIEDLKHNIVMIDNWNVLLKEEQSRLIQCPTYEFASYYDVLRLLDEETLRKKYVDISAFLSTYDMFPAVSPHTAFSYEVFKALYFETLCKHIKKNIKKNIKVDTFWQTLASIMAKAGAGKESFPDSTIRYINTKLNKKMS